METLPLFIAIPLAVAFLFPVFEKLSLRRALLDGLAVLATAALLAGSLGLLAQPDRVYWIGGWAPPVTGINLVSDGLSRLMLVVVQAISFFSIVFSLRYMDRYSSRGFYYGLFFLLLAGMNGVVLTGDLFNLFVFIEIAAIASYALVAFGCESEELEASFKYLVLGSVSSAFILLGVGMLYNLTGTLNMAEVAAKAPALSGLPIMAMVGACFLFGFGLKAAMVPFHAWLPDAHPSAPAPISAMLSGVLIKAGGVYVLFRLFFSVFGMDLLYARVFMALGAVSMLIGVLLAVGQWDFKRLLAYHSISQMGYVLLSVGVGGEVLARGGPTPVAALAVFAGLFHLVNHAAFKSLLFLCSGSMEYVTGTRQLAEMGGLSRPMPLTGLACRVAALSISGIPPFNGFWSKLLIIIAIVQAGHYALAALTVLVSFLTLLSFIKVQRYALEGPLPELLRSVREAGLAMSLPLLALAALCLLGGLLLPLYAGALFTPAQEAMLSGLNYARAILGG